MPLHENDQKAREALRLNGFAIFRCQMRAGDGAPWRARCEPHVELRTVPLVAEEGASREAAGGS